MHSSYSSKKSRKSFIGSVALFVGVILLAGIVMQACGAMVSSSKAISAAEDAGYVDIEVIDKQVILVGLRGCGEDDSARFTVRGTNARNQEREFYVCAGWLKGATIRSKG